MALAAVAAFIAHGVGQAAESGCSYENVASADQNLHLHEPASDTPDSVHGGTDGLRCCAAIPCGIAVPPAVEHPGDVDAPARSLNPILRLDGTLPGPIHRPPISV